jgi:hypothetical protein
MRKAVAVLTVGAFLAAPSVAQALYLTSGEARSSIRWWGRQVANDVGDTITRHKASDCFRSNAVRVVCWYEQRGFDSDGFRYYCAGEVRVIETSTEYKVAPIRHGRYRYSCV